tara:strand:- start:244 stop:531 length:288 start_codon:yes stop_codon:yes gene_type:complete
MANCATNGGKMWCMSRNSPLLETTGGRAARRDEPEVRAGRLHLVQHALERRVLLGGVHLQKKGASTECWRVCESEETMGVTSGHVKEWGEHMGEL